ncbi:MAG: peroxiredoxin-like family protein [Bacteroidota bacterium]
MKTHHGHTLETLSQQRPVLLVFLRHFGCTFCREALRDLALLKDKIEGGKGVQMVFVHMSPADYAEKMLDKYGLTGADHMSDPKCDLYKEMGLSKGTLKQLFGLRMWTRGFQVGILEGLGVGQQRGDGFQMPGYFVLDKGKVVESYIPKDAADHPDFLALASCGVSY